MSETKSFWATLPGILTGIAGVITAIGGLFTVLYQIEKIGQVPNGTPNKIVQEIPGGEQPKEKIEPVNPITESPNLSPANQEQFSVTVTNLQNGSEVGKETIVDGTALIPDGNYLWVLARRVDFEPLWWPQREAKIDPRTHKWSATVCFGGPQDINWDFHIGVITVNADGHRELMDYWTTAMKTRDWRPIEIPETTSPPRIIKVKKVRH